MTGWREDSTFTPPDSPTPTDGPSSCRPPRCPAQCPILHPVQIPRWRDAHYSAVTMATAPHSPIRMQRQTLCWVLALYMRAHLTVSAYVFNIIFLRPVIHALCLYVFTNEPLVCLTKRKKKEKKMDVVYPNCLFINA